MRRVLIFALLVTALDSEASQNTKDYKVLAAADVRFVELEPTGWQVTLVKPPGRVVEVKTLVADRIRVFTHVYLRGDRLVGLGKTTSGEAVLVWDLADHCQAAGAMGFGMKPSLDGRYVAFEQYVPRNAPPNGSIFRILDVDTLPCKESERGDEPMSTLVDVGPILLPAGATGPSPASPFETRSPLAWIGSSLVFVTRHAAANVLELHRYDPASRRETSRTLDWRKMASDDDLKHSPHPSANFAFKSITPVTDEARPGDDAGATVVRLRLVDDYLHRVKWVDVAVPEWERKR